MKIFAWVHLYPPDHCAGAEMMLHEILLGLKKRGHDVCVGVNSSSAPEWEGIPIYTSGHWDRVAASDIVITHLDVTRQVIKANHRQRPLVHLIHNDRQLKYHGVAGDDAQLVVANSEWILRAINWKWRTIVVRPPVHSERYKTKSGDAITLINLYGPKGARTFWQLARIMPDRKFVAVVGGYGAQDIADPLPPNVELVQHTPDIRKVYAKTRLLLMPSIYESWGRVAVEAMASGIPTIAHPTPGLLESLADSGTFADRDDIAAWVEAIRRFDDEAHYKDMSNRALLRSAELDPNQEIDALESAMAEIVENWNKPKS
jgi:glycosyltransferase involved in cell wall biosynthesis